MDENPESDGNRENGRTRSLVKPGLAIVAAGAALAAGFKMQDRIDIAAFRERILPERWKNSNGSIAPVDLADEEE